MKLRIIFLFFLILPLQLAAQWNLSPTLTVGFPVGEFSRNNNNIGVGLDLTLLRKLSDAPVSVGIQAAYLTFGRQQFNKTIDLNTVNKSINFTINHNISYFHAMARLKPTWGSKVIPFVDIVTGAKTLLTFAAISENQRSDSLNPKTSYNASWAFDLGAAAGIDIEITENLFFNFKTTFLSGTKIQFINPQSVKINSNNDLLFDERKLSSNMVLIHGGITFNF